MRISIWISAVLLCLASVAVFHQQIISWVVLPQYIAWAHETEALGLQTGQALDETQLSLAKTLEIKAPEKIRIVYVAEVPFPRDNFILKKVGEAFGFIGDGVVNNAQVFGYSIYVRQGYALTTANLAHELVHVRQIERSSLDRIVTQHFSDLAQYGYENSPLEKEAFATEALYIHK